MAAPLPIMKNLVWSPKRAGGRIVFASIAELRIVVAMEHPVNFVWPDEGAFFKLTGSEDTFKMNEGNETLPPLVVSVLDARRVLSLYDGALLAANQQKLETMLMRSRGGFAKVYDASVTYDGT